MKEKRDTKRSPVIGVLIDWSGNPFGIKIWTGITDYAKKHNANVLCFVGGAINTPYKYERQRNALFKLINKNNIDGLVVMTTLIDNFVKEAELNDFFSGFQDFPVLSLGRKIENIPSILIDNAYGMRELLHHLIEVDGHKRIAYIRGPENKSDALVRFRVFKETLEEHGIKMDPELIIEGKYDMVSGQLATFKLLDEKQLSFDVIVAANDAMALGAITALCERGIRVPEQVAVTGFDDFEIDLSIIPALTTVRQPLYEVGWHAARILLDKINGKPAKEVSIFNTELVLRESCGCFAALTDNIIKHDENNSLPAAGKDPKKQFKLNFTEMRNILNPLFIKFDTYNRNTFYAKIENLLNLFYRELTDSREGVFLAVWNDILLQAIQTELKVSIWREVLSMVHRYSLARIKSREISRKAGQLIVKAKEMLEETEEKLSEYKRVRIAHETLALRALGDELFTSVDLAELLEVIERNFPSLGINSCYLCLSGGENILDDNTKNNPAKTILAYNENGRIEVGEDGIFYDPSLIAPGDLLPQTRNYTFMIDILFHNVNQMGYVVLEMEPKQGGVYEVLSRRLRNALKGVLLLQQLQNQTKILSNTNKKLEQEIKDRKRAETALRDSELQLKTILEICPIPLVIYKEADGNILYMNNYFYSTFGISSRQPAEKTIYDYYADPHEVDFLHKKLYDKSFREPGYLKNDEVTVKKENGIQFTVMVSIEKFIFDEKKAVIAGFYDITDRKRLEKEILEISGREQQRIGQDLHDGLGQQLTGIGYMCKFLEGSLKKKGLQEAEDAKEIAKLVYQTIYDTRNLSQSLFPVNLEKNGLVYALQELAEKTENQYKLPCVFECRGEIVIEDNSVALHLYRIAQEAVHNAIKHAEPESITISLSYSHKKLSLVIEDDGTGLPDEAFENKGMGLHIMQYRCNIINGKIRITRADKKGTIVKCTLDPGSRK